MATSSPARKTADAALTVPIRPAAAPELLKRSPQASIRRLVVTRYEAISVDGTRIPYVQLGPPGETGEAAVHLSGYAASVFAAALLQFCRR